MSATTEEIALALMVGLVANSDKGSSRPDAPRSMVHAAYAKMAFDLAEAFEAEAKARRAARPFP